MSQHPNRGHVLPWEQALPLMVEMRQQGRSWLQVAHALGYSKIADLSGLRWQRAAEMRHSLKTITWLSIADDPAVNFKVDTLKGRHKTAKLACGLTWAEYFDGLAAKVRERVSLQQDEIATAYVEILTDRLAFLRRQNMRLNDYESNPPAGQSEQLALVYQDSGEAIPQRMKPEFSILLRQEGDAVIAAAQRVSTLLSGAMATDETSSATEALPAFLPEAEKTALLLEVHSLLEQQQQRDEFLQRAGVA